MQDKNQIRCGAKKKIKISFTFIFEDLISRSLIVINKLIGFRKSVVFGLAICIVIAKLLSHQTIAILYTTKLKLPIRFNPPYNHHQNVSSTTENRNIKILL